LRPARDRQPLVPEALGLLPRELPPRFIRCNHRVAEPTSAQALPLLRVLAERRDAPVRLDGVMRKELRELAFAFARMALDPPRDAIVRSRTIASRKALVRDLLGQHVAERVLAFTDDHRPESRVDEPAPLQ